MGTGTRQDWHYPRDGDLPPEGLVVETADSGGCHQDLVRKGRLWFVPDMSSYVYCTPQSWRLKPDAEEKTDWVAELTAANARLAGLLADPRPGLYAWCKAVTDAAAGVSRAAGL